MLLCYCDFIVTFCTTLNEATKINCKNCCSIFVIVSHCSHSFLVLLRKYCEIEFTVFNCEAKLNATGTCVLDEH